MRGISVRMPLGLALAASAACFGIGSVVVTGDIQGRRIDPQTILAFLDANEYHDDSGRLVNRPRELDRQVMHVRLDGASFDPNADFRFLDTEEILRIAQERTRNGLLKFRVERAGFLASGNEVSAGDAVSDPGDGKPRLRFNFGDGGGADIVFAAAELTKVDELPAEIPQLGSVRTVTVKFDNVGKKPGEITSGKITIEWKKKLEDPDKDPDTALEGKIEAEFEAENIGERVGECNNLDSNFTSGQTSSSGKNDSVECNDFTAG